jgi:hypothetical protein
LESCASIEGFLLKKAKNTEGPPSTKNKKTCKF